MFKLTVGGPEVVKSGPFVLVRIACGRSLVLIISIADQKCARCLMFVTIGGLKKEI